MNVKRFIEYKKATEKQNKENKSKPSKAINPKLDKPMNADKTR